MNKNLEIKANAHQTDLKSITHKIIYIGDESNMCQKYTLFSTINYLSMFVYRKAYKHPCCANRRQGVQLIAKYIE